MNEEFSTKKSKIPFITMKCGLSFEGKVNDCYRDGEKEK